MRPLQNNTVHKNHIRNEILCFNNIYSNKRYSKLQNRLSRKPILKGQMFIIGAVLLLVSVILIKDIVNIYPIIDEKNYINSIITEKNMRNVKNEFNYILGMVALRNSTNYMSNFSDYIRRDNYKSMHIITIVNGTTNNFTVTIGNYFGGDLNYTLNATDSTPKGYTNIVKDRSYSYHIFNTSTTGSIIITFNYTLDNDNIVETIPIDVKNRNFIQGFFDIKTDSLIYMRTKYLYNWSW